MAQTNTEAMPMEVDLAGIHRCLLDFGFALKRVEDMASADYWTHEHVFSDGYSKMLSLPNPSRGWSKDAFQQALQHRSAIIVMDYLADVGAAYLEMGPRNQREQAYAAMYNRAVGAVSSPPLLLDLAELD